MVQANKKKGAGPLPRGLRRQCCWKLSLHVLSTTTFLSLDYAQRIKNAKTGWTHVLLLSTLYTPVQTILTRTFYDFINTFLCLTFTVFSLNINWSRLTINLSPHVITVLSRDHFQSYWYIKTLKGSAVFEMITSIPNCRRNDSILPEHI